MMMEAAASPAAPSAPTVATAGQRGAGWGNQPTPADWTITLHPFTTSDNASIVATLLAKSSTSTAIMMTHPREYVGNHYLVPTLIEAGYAVWAQPPRSIGNDLRLEHETALLDVAAGIRALKALGFEKIILLGNSGGASLLTFYQAQAGLAASDRLSATPAGRPVALAVEDMPLADGLVYVSPHLGQGRLLMSLIDPSVTDEDDAFSTDPALDPFHPKNGFRRPPDSSSYDDAFVEAYRLAQRERVARIDVRAKDLIAQRLEARNAVKSGGGLDAMKRAAYQSVFHVWRTDADLRNWDLSLDPNNRKVGSLWGGNPFASNYGSIGFARLCTPESWLSTWSGLSSNADMLKTAPAIDVPVLTIAFDADPTVLPADLASLQSALGSADKTQHVVPGNHHGTPGGREALEPLLADWLRERFS
jgi:pimeloyl-ACP methyl ester carboxylesterase